QIVSPFFFQAEDGIRDATVTGVQTCALPILARRTRDCRPESAANPLCPSPCPRKGHATTPYDSPDSLPPARCSTPSLRHFQAPDSSRAPWHVLPPIVVRPQPPNPRRDASSNPPLAHPKTSRHLLEPSPNRRHRLSPQAHAQIIPHHSNAAANDCPQQRR